MRPEDAVSPRSRIVPGTFEVLYTSPDTEWSLAKMQWVTGSGIMDAVGVRWNGDINDPDDKGNPRSHSQGTWFILPEAIATLVLAALGFDWRYPVTR